MHYVYTENIYIADPWNVFHRQDGGETSRIEPWVTYVIDRYKI